MVFLLILPLIVMPHYTLLSTHSFSPFFHFKIPLQTHVGFFNDDVNLEDETRFPNKLRLTYTATNGMYALVKSLAARLWTQIVSIKDMHACVAECVTRCQLYHVWWLQLGEICSSSYPLTCLLKLFTFSRQAIIQCSQCNPIPNTLFTIAQSYSITFLANVCQREKNKTCLQRGSGRGRAPFISFFPFFFSYIVSLVIQLIFFLSFSSLLNKPPPLSSYHT